MAQLILWAHVKAVTALLPTSYRPLARGYMHILMQLKVGQRLLDLGYYAWHDAPLDVPSSQ